jgi:hypothetical protein
MQRRTDAQVHAFAVESDQLRSSSVLQDRPSVSGKYPGLEMIR